MATNSIPTNSAQLIGLAQKMHTGIVQLGAAIPITMLTAAQLQSALDAFVTQDGAFNAARSARQTASDSYQTATGAVYDWLLAVSNMLATRFGTRWNTEWAQAGFINHSTGIPAKIEERLGLALALVGFFTANPSYEVPSMNLTAAQGTALRTAALTAQQAVTAAVVALNTIGDTWTTAYDALTALMRTLIKNLEGKLAKNDPRWLAFGLQMPATSATPGQPLNLTAHTDGTGAIVVQCDAVPLATRYRWRMLLVGVQTDYQLAASSVPPLATIPGVLPGQTVQLLVQAVNGSLQGVASEPLIFTLPGAQAKEPIASPVALEVPHANGRSNGHSNGNGNGHLRHARAA